MKYEDYIQTDEGSLCFRLKCFRTFLSDSEYENLKGQVKGGQLKEAERGLQRVLDRRYRS